MLKSRDNNVRANAIPNYSDDTVRIEAGSIILDNNWISYKGIIFVLSDYIKSAVVGSRTRFFIDRNYAVYLLLGIDIDSGFKVVEGPQVKFNSLQSVPIPQNFSIAPLIGLVVIQDGTNDLNLGYVPLKDENIQFFNGMGNIIQKNIKGETGADSQIYGETGIIGSAGLPGLRGLTGVVGITGPDGLYI